MKILGRLLSLFPFPVGGFPFSLCPPRSYPASAGFIGMLWLLCCGGLGFRVQGFRVQGLGFAGSGFRVAEVFHSWVRLGGGSSWDLRFCPAQAPPSEFLEGKSELGVGKSELRVGKSELEVGKEGYFRFLGTVS